MANPRLPDSVKSARGTLRRERSNPKAPKLRAGKVPRPPRDLSPAERRVWRELARQVEHLGVYAPSDFSAFRLLVRLVVAAHGPGPASAVARAMQAANTALASFGLTPAARGKVSVLAPSEDEAEHDLFGPPRLVR